MRDPLTGAAIHVAVFIDPNTGAAKRIQPGKGGIDQDRDKGKSNAINLGVRREDEHFGGMGLGLFGVSKQMRYSTGRCSG